MASVKAVELLFSAQDNVTEALRQMGQESEKFKSTTTEAFREATAESMRFGEALKAVTFGNLLATGIKKAIGIVKNNFSEAVQYAASLQDVEFIIDKVFANSGRAIEEFAAGAGKQFGLTKLQAKNFTSGFGSLFMAMGINENASLDMSTTLAGRAADLASYKGMAREDAFRVLQSAMMGKTQSLDLMGFNVSATAMEEYAKAHGKVWKNLSKTQQMMLRYEAILEKTSQAEGDFARPGASYTQSAEIMKNALLEMKGALAEGFMDGIIKAADGITNIANAVRDWAEENKELIQTNFTAFVEFMVENIPKLLGFLNDHKNALISIAAGLLGINTIIKGMKIAHLLKGTITLLAGGVVPALAGAGTAAGAAGASATGAAGAFSSLAATIGLSSMAMAGLVGIAIAGIVALLLFINKNQQKWAKEEAKKWGLTDAQYAEDWNDIAKRGSDIYDEGTEKWRNAYQQREAALAAVGGNRERLGELHVADQTTVRLAEQTMRENEKYNNRSYDGGDLGQETALREAVAEYKSRNKDPLEELLDEAKKLNANVEDGFDGLEERDTTNLRWNKMGLDFWETMRLGV